MANVDHVLDAIDHALEDWEVSQDAMRWAPSAGPQQSIRARIPFAFDPPSSVATGLWQVIPRSWQLNTWTYEPPDVQEAIRYAAARYGVLGAWRVVGTTSSRAFDPQEPEED